MLKVTAEDNSVDYWALEVNYGLSITYRLRIYRAASNSNDVTATSDVILPSGVDLDLQSTFVFDGHSHVLLGTHQTQSQGQNQGEGVKAVVHVLSAVGHEQGRYEGHLQLVTSSASCHAHLDHTPYSLAVDKSRDLLYVGQWDGRVKVFTLKHPGTDNEPNPNR